MAIEHKSIPEDGLHEPKGASTAAGGTVYVSTGDGSGQWSFLEVPWASVTNKPSTYAPEEAGVYSALASKSDITALTALTDPSSSTLEEVAIKLNEVVAALKSGV